MSGHDTDRGQGEIFLDAENSGQPAAYFLNPMGDVRWYKPSTKKGGGPSIFNVRVQSYHARPVITYWRGVVQSPPGCGHGKGIILNEHYQTIHTVSAGDGYRRQGTDLHEFTLGHEGSEPVAFVPIWSTVHANLSSVGGPPNGTVVELEDPRVGKTTQLGPVIQAFGTPAVIRAPAPDLGAHTAEILERHGDVGKHSGPGLRQLRSCRGPGPFGYSRGWREMPAG